jgi:dTDP-4-amino-4,6-dideoxygalactose transaminase
MDYKIPLFDLNFDEAEERAVLEVLRSKWISTGPKTQEFEEKFSQMLGVKHAVALANCTVALHLAMILVGVEENDEVICPSLTFVATANAIRYVKATPVFADITSVENPTIDPNDIERKITPRTKAIVVMHYGGFACDMDRIMALAQKHNLKVVEDACHGPLSEYKGKKLGTIGDVGCFSFFSNKNISTGEGGMLVTNNLSFFERTKLLRSHGMTTMSYQRAKGHSTSYDVIELGYNYRMDDIRAAIGLVQLEKITNDLKIRAEIRTKYEHLLRQVEGVIVPFLSHPHFSSNYVFPIVIRESNSQKREDVRNALANKGIQTSIHYPAVHRFSFYEAFSKQLNITELFADTTITLPMYSKLKDKEIELVVNSLSSAVNTK